MNVVSKMNVFVEKKVNYTYKNVVVLFILVKQSRRQHKMRDQPVATRDDKKGEEKEENEIAYLFKNSTVNFWKRILEYVCCQTGNYIIIYFFVIISQCIFPPFKFDNWNFLKKKIILHPYLPTSPLGQDMTQGQFLRGV